MSKKVKELKDDEFYEEIVKKDADLIEKAGESNVNAEAIAKKFKPNVDKYGVSTGVSFVIARILEAVTEANSEEVKGLLVGERDRYSSNSPIRVPLLSSTGNHMELTSWGTSVKYGDSKIGLPFPSVATMKIMNEGEYKGVPSLRIVAIGSYEELSVSDTVARLNKVAKSVGEIDGSDELSVVVVKGAISFIAPATKWKDKEKDGAWQLYMPNARDTPQNHPVMQISLEKENGNQVRVVFDRQRNAVPTIFVEDFTDLCIDAVASSTDPTEQAKFLGGIVKGREVIIVGFMTKFNPQAEVQYVEVSGYAMFDADASAQSGLEKPKSAGKAGKPAGKPAGKSAGKKPADAEDISQKKTSGTGKGKETPFDRVKSKIKAHCEVLGKTPREVTAAVIMEKYHYEGIVEMGTIETALEELISEME